MNSTPSSPELRQILAILSRDPRNVAAHIKAGVYYSQEKKWEKSATHLKKALAGNKNSPLVLEKLTEVLISLRQPLQARKYARKLIELRKRDANAMHIMAKVHEALREMDKALIWIDRALAQEPKNERILLDKANFHSIAGELDESLAIHKRILELNPKFYQSWWPYAQLQKLSGKPAEEAIGNINAAMMGEGRNDNLRWLNFAAGKISHDIGQYGAAFEHFEKANLLHDIEVRPDKIIAANINFRETYSPKLFETKNKAGDHSQSPVFILGQTRSGTTLTESLCASHSNVSAGGELPQFTDFINKLSMVSLIENEHHDKIHALDQKELRQYASDFSSANRQLQARGTRLTDKMPHNFLNIGLIALVFPNAKIIHCRRHPMDNCLSIFSNPMLDYHKEYKSNLESLGEYYRNYVQIMEFWKETCPIPIHDVLYEDLVTNTETVARGMIDYIGEDWQDSVMDRSGSQKAVKTLSVWQVRQPVFQSSKGKWRNYEKQLQPLRDVLGDIIDDYEKELADLT